MEDVVVRGTSPAMVVYSYVHLPLLMALAGLGAGLRLLIDQAGADHLERGAAAALLGTSRCPRVTGRHEMGDRARHTAHGTRHLGIAAKSAAVAALAVPYALERSLPPPVLAAAVALVLVALVIVERTTIDVDEAADPIERLAARELSRERGSPGAAP
jgi:hypothetical protein